LTYNPRLEGYEVNVSEQQLSLEISHRCSMSGRT
jgi:hypothetical protein